MRALAERIRSTGGTVRLTAASLLLLVGLVVMPSIGPTLTGSAPIAAWHGRVTAILDPHRPDPTGAGGGFLPDARVLLLEGPRTGEEVEAYRQGPGGQQDSNAYRVGEDVVVSATGNPDGSTFLAIEDRWRLPQLVLLTAVFALAVVAVGGWRGARALLGLALTVAILLKVLIPLLVAGAAPIPVAVVVATGLTILAIGLTEGLGRPGVAAILGTGGALALTAILAALVTAASGFTNTLGSELASLTLPNGAGLDLRGILLAAFMIGAIGVLDDVTVTQAIAVDELARAGVAGRELFRAAFGIGRSHIAATVNTLFLAYAGAALPLLILLVVGNQPTALLLNGETIAIEIVRTMVGGLGIVAAVPLTTLIAAWLVEGSAAASDAHPRRVIVGTLAAGLSTIALVTVLAAAVLGPLTSTGPRTPIPPDSFGGVGRSPSPPPTGPSASPIVPQASGPGIEDGPVFAVGDSIPLFSLEGKEIGSVVVVRVDPVPVAETRMVLHVQLRFSATRPIKIDPDAWVVHTSLGDSIASDGTTEPDRYPPFPRTVGAGRTATGWLNFVVDGVPSAAWVDYVQAGTNLFAIPLL